MNGTMNLELIHEDYRAEMVGVFGELAELVRKGTITPRGFLEGQKKIYDVYRRRSLELVLIRMA